MSNIDKTARLGGGMNARVDTHALRALAVELADCAPDIPDAHAPDLIAAAADAVDELVAEVEGWRAEADHLRGVMEHCQAEVARLRADLDAARRTVKAANTEVARLRAALVDVAHHVLVLWVNGAEEADSVTTLNTVARIVEPIVREIDGETNPVWGDRTAPDTTTDAGVHG